MPYFAMTIVMMSTKQELGKNENRNLKLQLKGVQGTLQRQRNLNTPKQFKMNEQGTRLTKQISVHLTQNTLGYYDKIVFDCYIHLRNLGFAGMVFSLEI